MPLRMERGVIQQAILSELVEGISEIAEVDFAKARQRVTEQLPEVDLTRPY